MTALQVRDMSGLRQAISTLGAVAFAALVALSCAAPISTMRSPFHLRVVELRNTTGDLWVIEVAPAEGQDLMGGATTFTGVLEPGEVKTLYLYHGFEYTFVVRERAAGHAVVSEASAQVDRDLGFEFAGDSLVQDEGLVVRLGEPTVSFADSLMRGTGDILPDTTRGQGVAADKRLERERERREEADRRRRGEIP